MLLINPEDASRGWIEVSDLALGSDEQHRVNVGLDHFGQASLVLLGLHPGRDVPGYADDFDHRPGVGFADRPAGGFEPQVVAVAMANAIGHGVIAILLQRIARALHQSGQVLAMKQALGHLPAQLFRPVTEQGPGRR
ncbi:hypothetical protein D3C86_1618230 [compost metagenome]